MNGFVTEEIVRCRLALTDDRVKCRGSTTPDDASLLKHVFHQNDGGARMGRSLRW